MEPQYKEVDGNIGSGRFIIGTNDHNYSNEEVVLDANAEVWREGRIMGQRTRGGQTIASAQGAGNVGDGTLDPAPTADAGADAGVYRGTFLDADTIRIEDPGGVEIGVVAAGAAFDGPVNFTYVVGATPNAAGDTFTITVGYAAANLRWRPVDPDATDGTQVAAGILFHRQGTTAAPSKNVVVARHQVVNGNLLDFGDLDANQVAVAEAQLAGQGIIVRY